VASGI